MQSKAVVHFKDTRIKLEEAYKKAFGSPMLGVHSAAGDAWAASKLYHFFKEQDAAEEQAEEKLKE